MDEYYWVHTESEHLQVLQEIGVRAGLYGHCLAEQHAIAFAMIAHPRLGAESRWHKLPEPLMPLVNRATARVLHNETAQSLRARSIV